jgi:hypothetical protein
MLLMILGILAAPIVVLVRVIARDRQSRDLGGGPGWYPDPLRRCDTRYFDGSRWTEHVTRGGTAGTDPTGVGRRHASVTNRPHLRASRPDLARASADVTVEGPQDLQP